MGAKLIKKFEIMTKSNEKQLFIDLLKRYDALIPFIINIQNEKCRFYDNWENITLSQALNSKRPHMWSFLFRWDDTLEGDAYWKNIHWAWKNVRRKALELEKKHS
jgi:hypothetical protein